MFWSICVLAVFLSVYLVVVFIFQCSLLTSQIYHDEIQDVETVEGLLRFEPGGALSLRADYLSHPQSNLLIDRLMEVRDLQDVVLYRSPGLHGKMLGPPSQLKDEGEDAFKFGEHMTRLNDGTLVLMISHRHPVEGRMVLIRLGYSLSPLADRMKHFLLALLLALPIALLAAGLAGHHFVRKALLPLESMAYRAEKITASNLSGRLLIEDEEDEVGRMGVVLNSLLLRLESSFAQLQRFTADAAHELRTPLTSIRAAGEGALEGEQSFDSYRNAVGSILEETSRLSETVEGLLLISQAEAGQIPQHFSSFPLSELVSEIVFLLDLVMEERKITIEQSPVAQEQTLVFADRTLLRTGVVNVLHNAIKFSPLAGTIHISFASLELNGKQFVRLSISDEGPGIAPADREKVFERFFRLRDPSVAQQEGAGLGLAIAALVLDANRGRIYFDKNDLPGALCQIEVPAANQPID